MLVLPCGFLNMRKFGAIMDKFQINLFPKLRDSLNRNGSIESESIV